MAQIKKDTSLRKAILQAAITGQLISDVDSASFENQNSVSERSERQTGKELLDRIIEERNKKLIAEWEEALKKNPKAKKPAPVVASEIDEEEIPFEIPENWCWCRLKDIFFMQAGKTISSSKIFEIRANENPYPCFGGNGLRGYVSNYNKEGSYPIIGRQGALCGCINIATGKFYATEHAVVVDCFDICNYQWASWFLIALNLNQYATATAQPGLAVNKIETVLIPLPPLAVQNAIVAKLEQVLLLADAYENAILQKEELKSALPDKVKKAILQEAITGKLTEVCRKSASIKESGKQLLDRIIEERNAKEKMSHGLDFANAKFGKKKTKKETALAGSNPCGNIPEDEIPFEVPESWCWCRWGELSELIQYGYNAPAKEFGRIKMVRITDIQNGKVQWETVPYCDISDDEIITYKLKKNDILFARTGGTVGKSFLVEEEPEDAVYAGYLIRTQYDAKKLNPKYMKMFMESQLYWEQLKNGTIATAQPNCNGQTLSKMILPLPPLEEQEEIVKKMEELLPLFY